MKRIWTRAALALAVGAAGLLAACGSGTTVGGSNLHASTTTQPDGTTVVKNPAVSLGDGFQDVGQGPTGNEYTVNDGSGNWVQSFVSNYGFTMTPAKSGGWGYAQGGAQVNTEVTDADGNVIPSVADQVTALLTRMNGSLGSLSMVLINGGMSDIVAAVNATDISDATNSTVKAAADALANQIQRLVDAGATHVLVTGVYDLGTTPWAANHGGVGIGSPVSQLATAFNSELKAQINHFSSTSPNPVLFADAAQFFDFAYNSVAGNINGGYGLSNVTTAVCTTASAVNCTPSTVIDSNYNAYLFADDLYTTPNIQRLFVNTSYLGNMLSNVQNTWGS